LLSPSYQNLRYGHLITIAIKLACVDARIFKKDIILGACASPKVENRNVDLKKQNGDYDNPCAGARLWRVLNILP
jgi:hypothetical protein